MVALTAGCLPRNAERGGGQGWQAVDMVSGRPNGYGSCSCRKSRPVISRPTTDDERPSTIQKVRQQQSRQSKFRAPPTSPGACTKPAGAGPERAQLALRSDRPVGSSMTARLDLRIDARPRRPNRRAHVVIRAHCMRRTTSTKTDWRLVHKRSLSRCLTHTTAHHFHLHTLLAARSVQR